MSFNSIFFLFVFLPASLVLYIVTPKRLRNITLVLISLLFYAWGTPEYLVLLLLSIVFNYISGLEIDAFWDANRPFAARTMLIVAIIGNLLFLGFFKYYGFLISNLNAIAGLRLSAPELPLPLGISFFTFSALSYVLDVYWGKTPAQKNFLNYAVYVAFFPKVGSGPIVQYSEMEPQLEERQITLEGFGDGVSQFLLGLFKKVLISDNLGVAFAAISGMNTMSVGTAWLGMICYSLQLYFDFSGYSDMAIGMAKLFGFQFGKNFDYPYCSGSVSEFWRRWHISLGSWFREYVYITMGGNRCSKMKNIRNLAVVWLLTGLWHGASWNFILWGVYHGAFVLLEKFVLKDFLKKIPKYLRVCGTVFVVFLGWVLFFSPSLSDAIHYYGQMFGAGHMGVFDSTFQYYLFGNLPLIIIAAIGCGPVVRHLHQRLCYQKSTACTVVSIGCYMILLIISVAYLMNATYTSFLYFQF